MKENRIHQLTGRTCIKIEFYYQRIMDTVSWILSSLTEKKMEMEKTKNRTLREDQLKQKTHQFNDAMTEENFLLCSIKGKQMIYNE